MSVETVIIYGNPVVQLPQSEEEYRAMIRIDSTRPRAEGFATANEVRAETPASSGKQMPDRYRISKRCTSCGHEEHIGYIEGSAEAAMAAAKELDTHDVSSEIVIKSD